MANKKILLSDENGKARESSAILVDDATGKSTITDLKTVTSTTISNISGILSASNGVLSSIGSTSVTGDIIRSTGTAWQSIPSGTLYGDLSGSVLSPVVKSITNVSSGSLRVANGGTGLASPTANTLLLGNGTSAVTTSSVPSTNNVAKVSGSSWIVGAHPSENIIFGYSFYTASTTFNVPTEVQYIRAIIQGGGGGGGGGGGKSTTTALSSGGGGGGGGGLTDVTISTYDISGAITINVGAGGDGALSRTAAANTGGLNGSAGGDSYIEFTTPSAATVRFTAAGGGAGLGATTSGGAGGVAGAGGYGITANGGNGGTGAQQSNANTNMSGSTSIGAGGGGGGGGNQATPVRSATGPGGDGGIVFGIKSTGGAGNASGATSATNGTAATKQLRTYGTTTSTISPASVTLQINAGGGSGGTASTTLNTAGGVGGNGSFGSGGGGGGASVGTVATPAPQNGGNGGVGYILLIYWI
jgi:hypothetical protein